MKRRSFIKSIGAALTALAAPKVLADNNPEDHSEALRKFMLGDFHEHTKKTKAVDDFTIEASLPKVKWRKMNEGVPSNKPIYRFGESTTEIHGDTSVFKRG